MTIWTCIRFTRTTRASTHQGHCNFKCNEVPNLDFFNWNIKSKYQRRQWHPTPVLLPGKSHGRRSLVGCSPWGSEESDTTEQLHFHFLLSCLGEGNGNPLQCSCLENPRERGAWRAAIYGVAQSWTRMKRLSSSGSSKSKQTLFIYHNALQTKKKCFSSLNLILCSVIEILFNVIKIFVFVEYIHSTLKYQLLWTL